MNQAANNALGDSLHAPRRLNLFKYAIRTARTTAAIIGLCVLAACGGGGGGGSTAPSGGGPTGPGTGPVDPPPPPPTSAQAARFLTQATFGPNVGEIQRVTQVGYQAWLDEQFAKPNSANFHLNYMNERQNILQAQTPPANVNQNTFFESWWRQSISADDQLRQRVAFALSQIFVVSYVDSTVSFYTRTGASYYDMLAANAFGNYRNLLEQVSLHPAMGIYLSHMRNQKESGTRVPDENYAREVMQLFSIGLVELNMDGTPRRNAAGNTIDTYNDEDIKGLAKVFTGFSWYGGTTEADRTDTRFFGGNAQADREWQPMQAYAKYHSTSEKKFIGVTIAPQTSADPAASLKTALDRLATHPNTAPFISKQLIQRLITSNPSPAYVERVATVFKNSNGDLKRTINAIYVDTEARNLPASTTQYGKLKEPLLRATAWARGFNAKSDSGRFLMGSTDDPLNALGQTPLRSPSVFNFWRPGYVPPNTTIATANLTAPEFQITAETSVVGYLNTMRNAVGSGIGNRASGATRNDIQPDYSAELALAEQPAQLVDRIDLILTQGRMNNTLKQQIRDAVNSVAIPTSNQTNIDAAKRNRVMLAIYLALSSNDFIVQQ